MVSKSNTVTNSISNIVEQLVLDIEGMINMTKDEDSANPDAVCVYRVPKSVSSAKPEAFTPQFVGLGPYHHCRPQLYAKENMKVASVKRVLNLFPNIELKSIVEKLRNSNLAATIRDCYHSHSGIEFHDDNLISLLYLMTVDALFLYDLLGSLVIKKEDPSHAAVFVAKYDLHIPFLTGKHGMPLVNSAGVELSTYAIIGDAFMLENQIPTDVLKQIIGITSEGIQSREKVDKDLGSAMLKFCNAVCPLTIDNSQLEKFSKNPEAHPHLLDLMYNLIVHKDKQAKQAEAEDKQAKQGEPEPEPESEPESEPADEQHDHNDDLKNSSTCFCILVFLLAFCYLMVCILLLLPLICVWELLHYLVRLLKQLPGICFKALELIRHYYHVSMERLKGWAKTCSPGVRSLRNFLADSDNPVLKALATLVGQLNSTNLDTAARPPVMIASVTELDKAGIRFRPAKGGISSVEFDEESGTLKLPKMRLDVNSEVIMRNLVAYELLTKSDRLLFTRFVELMRAIIDTAEDVHLLVKGNIIESQLKDEEVTELFNGMSKSIRPTKARDLDEEIKKVNRYFDRSRELDRAMTRYVYSSWRFLTFVAALALLALTALQTYCSVYSCSRHLKFSKAA